MKPNVLLIHGVLMNPLEMRYLGKQLENAGFQVHYVYYQSVLKKPAENAKAVYQKIAKLNLPDLHIVAHSLGGIITLHLLDQYKDIPEGRVVMLGSPVQGSSVAQRIQSWPVLSPLLSQSMQQGLSGDGLPDWTCGRDWGMIAGDKNIGIGSISGKLNEKSDGTVLVKETKHPQLTEHIVVNKSHTALLFSKTVANLTIKFLQTGSFKQAD